MRYLYFLQKSNISSRYFFSSAVSRVTQACSVSGSVDALAQFTLCYVSNSFRLKIVNTLGLLSKKLLINVMRCICGSTCGFSLVIK